MAGVPNEDGEPRAVIGWGMLGYRRIDGAKFQAFKFEGGAPLPELLSEDRARLIPLLAEFGRIDWKRYF